MTAEEGILRPPSESRSLLIRLVRNCPWNRCRFCPAYKAAAFSVRPVDEVLADIEELAQDPLLQQCRNAFLQDADALVMPVESLVQILGVLRQRFPNLSRITSYARATTLFHLRDDDLSRLHQAGLGRIHVGIETGCDEVLRFMDKGTSHNRQKEACIKVKAAGIELCCYLMPGLGGRRWSVSHAQESARLVREVEPHHVRLRTCYVLAGTPLAEDLAAGRYEPQTEEEIVREIRLLLTEIASVKTELISDHRINLLLELRGYLPDDYQRLLGIIDRYLSLPTEDKQLFEAGRRLGLIRFLDELNHEETRAKIRAERHRYQPSLPVPVSVLF
ncbi:MAG TPA: radical SAM protein [Candidatus Ozemobacteraceae bacterium]|nr:radical SAM protein [Candidatus Ozemobacteraceae bacterium]